MNRRLFLQALGAGSVTLFLPVDASANLLTHGNFVSLRSLGHVRTKTIYLDGRTGDGSVALAPERSKKFSGTKWRVSRAGEGVIALNCQGLVNGPRWLDGRTHNGTVGLAPNTQKPFTGTRWQIVPLDAANPNIIALKCLGHIEGHRWLDGRTHDGTVALAPNTEPPYTGTRWLVENYPVRLAEPEGRPGN